MFKPTSLGWILLSLLLAGLAIAPQRPVDAGIALRMDVDQMVRRAGLVLAGRVLAQRPLVADNGRIDTEYTLSVDRTFWGEDRGQRTVRIPGGVLPSGRGLMLPGMPRLVPGEEVVLLLSESDKDGVCVPMGLAQGKYRIVTNRAGVRVAVRAQSQMELLQPGTNLIQPDAGDGVMEYAELVARIETAVTRRRLEPEAE